MSDSVNYKLPGDEQLKMSFFNSLSYLHNVLNVKLKLENEFTENLKGNIYIISPSYQHSR